MYTIQSTQELKLLISDLEKQGFPIDSTVIDKAIKVRVSGMVRKANRLNFGEDTEKIVRDTLANYTDFSEMERVIRGYFDRKTPVDRIRQIVGQLALRATDTLSVPFASDRPKTWEEYRAKLAKYNLRESEVSGDYRNLSIYDFRKKTIRIFRLKDHLNTFAQLVNLLTGEASNSLNSYAPTGEWLKASKSIEVKFYKDDSGELRGPIEQLKQYYVEEYAPKAHAVVIT